MTQPISPGIPPKGERSLKPGQFRTGLNPQNNIGINIRTKQPPTIDSQDVNTKTEIKSDGTKETTEYRTNGYTVARELPNGNNSSQTYNSNLKLASDYAYDNETKTSIGHGYDDAGRVTIKAEKEYENDGIKEKTMKYTNYQYHDNNQISEETIRVIGEGKSTTIKYDENGNRTEKFEKKGAVTTYYDNDDNPIRRETNMGRGIIESEDLTE